MPDLKQNIYALKIIILLSSTAIIYIQDFQSLINESLNNDLYTHILLIPILLAYIIYRRRNIILASISYSDTNRFIDKPLNRVAIGSIISASAIFIRLYGSYTFTPIEIHVLSLPMFLIGTTITLFNIKTLKSLLFPILFTILLIPIPITIAQQIGAYLSVFSSNYSYNLLKLLGYSVSLENGYGSPIIYLDTAAGRLAFSIDLACSGLYSLTGFVVFAVFLSYISRIDLKRKPLLLLVGIPIIALLNIVRIVIIVIVGSIFGESVALNSVHILGGWILIFIGTMALFIALDKLLKIKLFSIQRPVCDGIHGSGEDHCALCGKITSISKPSYNTHDSVEMIIVIGIVIFSLLVRVPIFSLSQHSTYLNIQDIVTGSTMEVLPKINGYDLSFLYRDQEFEKISGQNASLMYQYIPLNNGSNTYVGLEIGSSMSTLHPWEVCLVTWPTEYGTGSRVTELDLHDTHLTENPPISARYFSFIDHSNNQTEVVLYWYTNSFFRTDTGFERQYIKMSVIKMMNDPTQYLSAEHDIRPIAEAIIQHWEPKSEWSYLALFLVRNASLIVSSAVIVALLAIVITEYEQLNKMREASRNYHYLNEHEKKIIDIIDAKDKKVITENYIQTESKNKGVDLTYKELHQFLHEAEEAGLIQSDLVSLDDEPYLTWRKNVK